MTPVVSNSVRPQRRQPTRLPRPWDSPGKNTGVGCHSLLQCMKVKSESEVAQSCPTLATPWTTAHQAPPSMGYSRQEYWSGVPLPSLVKDVYPPPRKNKGFPWWSSGWESTCQGRGQGFNPWSGTIPHATVQLSPCTTAVEPRHPRALSSAQFSLSVVSDSMWPHGLQHARLPCPSATHVYRVGDAIQPSHPLSSPRAPTLQQEKPPQWEAWAPR